MKRLIIGILLGMMVMIGCGGDDSNGKDTAACQDACEKLVDCELWLASVEECVERKCEHMLKHDYAECIIDTQCEYITGYCIPMP